MIHLTYNKKVEDPIYYAQISVRHGKTVSSRTIKRIGKHSELLQITDDPLSYAQNEVANLDASYKEDIDTKMDIAVNFKQKVPATNNIASQSTARNIGYFYIQYILSQLQLKAYCAEIMKDRKAKYDAYGILRFISYARILHPASKLATCRNLSEYYEKPDISHQQVLRFMDVLSDHYNDYLEHLFVKSSRLVKRNTDICYYDCTNFYFEIEKEDEDYIDPVTGEIVSGLRKYGFSKEHRPNPIVGMGLFMDADGLPITMCLYSGANNEQITALPLEKQMNSMFKNKTFVYCADAGLGSYDIRKYNSFGERAFVITQSIKKLSDAMQSVVFDNTDYKLLSSDQSVTIEELKGFDKEKEDNLCLYKDKAYKVFPADLSVELNGFYDTKELANGSSTQTQAKGVVKQYIVVTFSRKMFEYQRFIRNRQIQRAIDLLQNAKNPEDIKKGPNDIRRFIRRKSKEKTVDAYEIDLDRIAKEEKYDGFYATATNLPVMNQNDCVVKSEVERVLKIQRDRYKIEECFRIMKTDFNARPVYHSLDNRIRAHFLFCYTALLAYRLLEKLLSQKGYSITIDNIIETIQNMNVADSQGLYWMSLFTGSKTLDALEDLTKLGIDRLNYKPNALNRIIKKIL